MPLTRLKNPTASYTMPNALPLGQTGSQKFNTGQTDRQTNRQGRQTKRADETGRHTGIYCCWLHIPRVMPVQMCDTIYILQRSCLFKCVSRYTYCNGHACSHVCYDIHIILAMVMPVQMCVTIETTALIQC